MPSVILDIRDLSVSFHSGKQKFKAVDGIGFMLRQGSTLGIVGESGSGKSITALSVMRLLSPASAQVSAGKMILYDREGNPTDLTKLPEKTMRQIRGKRISMIFQEPMTSLNPVMRCGRQVVESILAHSRVLLKEARKNALDLFREVKLPDPEEIFRAYPHELSGGQKQRVMIAMAIASRPDILIADEPTTALDVTVQKSIIGLLRDLQSRYGMAMIFITHDLGLIASVAGELLVMKEGMIVEQGQTKEIFNNPRHPYTQQLLAGRLSLEQVPERKTPSENPETLLSVEKLETFFRARGNKSSGKLIKAVDTVSLQVNAGEVLGLVGESGCGKTTLGRSILRLVEPRGGRIKFRNKDLSGMGHRELKSMRKEMQIIFQDPYSSLNPRISIGSAIMEPMTVHKIGLNRKNRKELALKLLDRVGLGSDFFDRYPHELSGGQRQRVCIARALSLQPSFIICDESVSALDITIQARILNLLRELREEFHLTYIFISHDLSVVYHISDRIAVMKNGKIEECGTAEQIIRHPSSSYTKNLIAAIPS
jgi:peptide/nickel transport system ATP-binding protein